MEINIDGDVDLEIGACETWNISFSNVSVSVGWDGALVIDDLRIDGAPFPRRGGPVSDFDRELARRLLKAIRKDWGAWIKHRWDEDHDDRRIAAREDAFAFQRA